jgi:hypothetical protein
VNSDYSFGFPCIANGRFAELDYEIRGGDIFISFEFEIELASGNVYQTDGVSRWKQWFEVRRTEKPGSIMYRKALKPVRWVRRALSKAGKERLSIKS